MKKATGIKTRRGWSSRNQLALTPRRTQLLLRHRKRIDDQAARRRLHYSNQPCDSAPNEYRKESPSIHTGINRKIHRVDTKDRQRSRHPFLVRTLPPRPPTLANHLLYSAPSSLASHHHPTHALTASPPPTTAPTISSAHPSVHKNPATATAHPNIYGRRLPHRSVELSEMEPMIGCTMRPESGGAIHTSEVCDLARPSARRWGVKSARGRGGVSGGGGEEERKGRGWGWG